MSSTVILTAPTTISSKQQRKWIRDNISGLSQQDTQDVYRFASTKIPKEKFIAASDGCRISFDASISDEIILQIYNLVRSKLQLDTSDV
jgi:hypothetical protein